MYKQHAPFAVQIELTQGCNLACSFCGINAIGYQQQHRGLDFMTLRTAESVAKQIAEHGWVPRIEFAMHGEPTLNPYRAVIVQTFREWLPKAYLLMTSNGGALAANTTVNVDELFNAGLNTLALEDYKGVKLLAHILAHYKGRVEIKRYPQNPTGNPHQRHNGQFITVLEDISTAKAGTHSSLNNHAGSAAPIDTSCQTKRCAKPFRELSIRWDGNVAICCNDWPGYYHCGNVVRDGLLTVWHGPAFDAARRELMARGRTFTPCMGCNALSYRVGLLPDPLGKQRLQRPTAQTDQAITEALKGRPYTKPVRPPLVQIKEAV